MNSPILIYGDGRSGTTMLQLIMDSHSEVYLGGETHFNSGIDLGPSVLNGQHKGFIAKMDRCGISEEEMKIWLSSKVIQGFRGESIKERCQLMRWAGETMAKRSGKKIWGFKMMRAFGFTNQCPWKDAKHIMIYRDPRDVYASQKQWQGKEGQNGSWGYKDEYVAGATWKGLINSWPKNHPMVKYEDINNHPTGAISCVCDDLDLRFEYEMVFYTDFEHALFQSDKSHYSKEQLRRPMNNESVGRWHDDLTHKEAHRIEEICGREMGQLGYDL